MAIKANEPSEDLYGERLAEAVALRSQVLIALGEQHLAAVQRETAEFDAAAAVAAAAAKPAPVVSTPPAVQRAPAAEVPTLKLGQINERLGYVVTADLLGRLGFIAHSDRSAKLYREGDFKAICAALSKHTLTVAALVLEAA